MPGNQSWSHCFQLKMLLFMGLCDVLDVQRPFILQLEIESKAKAETGSTFH